MAPLLIAAMTPFVKDLLANGLSLLGNAVMTKGKDYVEQKLGVELPPEGQPLPPEKLVELRNVEFEHEEALQQMAIRRAEIELEGEKAEAGAISDRWRTDMSSDSWLSKNIRPVVLAYLTGVISMMAFASQWLKVENAWIELLGTAYVTVIVAYFGSRGIEKFQTIKVKK